jgi:hypothetical protein
MTNSINRGERLPEAARAKLNNLARVANDAEILGRATQAQIEERAQLLAGVEEQRAETSDPDHRAKLERGLRDLASEITTLREEAARRFERATEARQVVVNLQAWINALPPHIILKTVPAPLVTVSNNDFGGAINSCRATIVEARREIQMTRDAPLTAAELKAQARTFVAKLAQKANPRLRGATGSEPLGLRFGDHGSSQPSSLLEALAVFVPDTVIARIDSLIEAEVIPTDALSSAERA